MLSRTLRSIQGRLILSSMCLAMLAGGVGYLGYRASHRANDAYQATISERLPALQHLANLSSDLRDALIAERSMLLFSMEDSKSASRLTEHTAKLGSIEATWTEYTQLTPELGERAQRSAFEAAFGAWQTCTRAIVSTLEENSPAARADAIDVTITEGQELFDATQSALATLDDTRLRAAADFAETVDEQLVSSMSLVLSLVLVAFAIAAAAACLLTRSVVRPLRQVIETLKDYALGGGDLTARLPKGKRDEVGELAHWFNQFVANLQSLLSQVRAGTQEIDRGAQQVSSSSQQLTRLATNQRDQMAGMAGALESIGARASQNARTAQAVSNVSDGATQSASTGQDQVEALGVAVSQIGESSDQISKVIKVIDDIAFQTNLLALNAAVEAARAGEAGRGFSVVAEEVRSLAIRSATAAKDTEQLIEESRRRAHVGIETSEKVRIVLEEITSSVADVNEQLLGIVEASFAQSEGIAEIKTAIASTESANQESVAMAEALAAIAEETAGQVSAVNRTVGIFRLDDENNAQVRATPMRLRVSQMWNLAAPLTPSSMRMPPTGDPANIGTDEAFLSF